MALENCNSSYSMNSNSSNNSLTSINYMDDLVKEYLLYRGFNTSLKSFENDLKTDKERCFKADKITELILSYIYSFDLNGLIEYWNYLEHKYLSKTTLKISSNSYITKKYELNLLRFYLVNALKCSKLDKAYEFFENYASKQQSQVEWKEWYCLPFLKNPDDHPTFSIYFSQNWIDAFIVSLQNFLTIVFQSITFPRLLNYEEDFFWKKNNKKRSDDLEDYFNQEFGLLTDDFQVTDFNLENNQENTFITMIKNFKIINNQKQPKIEITKQNLDVKTP